MAMLEDIMPIVPAGFWMKFSIAALGGLLSIIFNQLQDIETKGTEDDGSEQLLKPPPKTIVDLVYQRLKQILGLQHESRKPSTVVGYIVSVIFICGMTATITMMIWSSAAAHGVLAGSMLTAPHLRKFSGFLH